MNRRPTDGMRVLFDLGPDLPSEGTITGHDWQYDTYTITTDKGMLTANAECLVPMRRDVSTVERLEAFLADDSWPTTFEFHSHVAVFVQACSCVKLDGQKFSCGCAVRRTVTVSGPRPKVIVAHDANVTSCRCAKSDCGCVRDCDVA